MAINNYASVDDYDVETCRAYTIEATIEQVIDVPLQVKNYGEGVTPDTLVHFIQEREGSEVLSTLGDGTQVCAAQQWTGGQHLFNRLNKSA